jgi:hypothetical protein
VAGHYLVHYSRAAIVLRTGGPGPRRF